MQNEEPSVHPLIVALISSQYTSCYLYILKKKPPVWVKSWLIMINRFFPLPNCSFLFDLMMRQAAVLSAGQIRVDKWNRCCLIVTQPPYNPCTTDVYLNSHCRQTPSPPFQPNTVTFLHRGCDCESFMDSIFPYQLLLKVERKRCLFISFHRRSGTTDASHSLQQWHESNGNSNSVTIMDNKCSKITW